MVIDPRTGLPILHPAADEGAFEEVLLFAFQHDEAIMAAYKVDRLGEVEERLKPWIHAFGQRGELLGSRYRAASITPERIVKACANPDQTEALIALGRDALKYAVAERLLHWLTNHPKAVRHRESLDGARVLAAQSHPMLA